MFCMIRFLKQLSHTTTAILLLGIITSALDGIFTVDVLSRGGYEVNPIVRFLVTRIGAPIAVFLTRVGIFGLLFAFWMLGDSVIIALISIVTACAALFTGRSVLASRLGRGSGFSEISES